MLSNRKSNFTYLSHGLISRVYFWLTEARYIDVRCNTWLFLINPVNGLAFVCLSSFYDAGFVLRTQ